jgi:hypothetical protein
MANSLAASGRLMTVTARSHRFFAYPKVLWGVMRSSQLLVVSGVNPLFIRRVERLLYYKIALLKTNVGIPPLKK